MNCTAHNRARANHFTRSEPTLATDGSAPVVAVSSMSVLLQSGRHVSGGGVAGAGEQRRVRARDKKVASMLRLGDVLADGRLLGSNQAIAGTRLHQAAPPAVHRQFADR